MLSSALANRRTLTQRCLTGTGTSTTRYSRCNITALQNFLTHNHGNLSLGTSSNELPSQLIRKFSSNGGSYGTPNGPLRSQPQYAIFGEKTMLSIKMIPPVFRCLKNGSLVLDQNKKGRILLEWSARGDAGK